MDWKKTFKSFSLNQVQGMYLLSALVFLVALVLAFWWGYQYYSQSLGSTALVEFGDDSEGPCEYRRVLDGVCVATEEETNPKIVTVMVENHPEARPQAGLSRARVVYEAPVEANYSRFMLVYLADQEVDKIGPVRSARPYYLDWLAEYADALYMHVGGSPAALELIGERGVNDLNEFYRGWFYWRASNRSAPHNVYTNSEYWEDALEYNEELYADDIYSGWRFGDFDPCEEDCVTEITASFLPPTYEATWTYSTSTNQYERSQTGYAHRDDDGEPIVADTVVVQRVDSEVLDEIGRIAIDTIGSGEAIVFRNGFAIEGEWRKPNESARTRFFADGEEVELQAGVIWVEVVNERGSVDYQ